jgi:acetyltransferase-like isoleucine patch superfamily enzyme
MASLKELTRSFLDLVGAFKKILVPVEVGRLGSGSVLNRHVELSHLESIFIAVGVSIAPGVSLGESSKGSITIGDHCAIAARTRFVTSVHDYNVLPVSSVGINRSIVVGSDVWI